MKNLIIAIDKSTSATKAMLFNERCEMLRRVNVTHEQYYPRTGWVEHDADEIWSSMLGVAVEAMNKLNITPDQVAAIGITNQR